MVMYAQFAPCREPPDPRVLDAPDRRDRRACCSWPALARSRIPWPARRRRPGTPSQLSTRVQSVQTVGIIGQAGQRLTGTEGAAPCWSARPPGCSSGRCRRPAWCRATRSGPPTRWPAGRTSSSTRLTASAWPPRPGRAIRCWPCAAATWAPAQRWQRFNSAVAADGHLYGQYRNLGTGRCLAAGAAPRRGPGPGGPGFVRRRAGHPAADLAVVGGLTRRSGPAALVRPARRAGPGRTGRAACRGGRGAARPG